MEQLTAVVIFGGQSSEHAVSCMSALNVIAQIDSSMYQLILIGITKEGRWLKVDSLEDIQTGQWVNSRTGAILSPDAVQKSVIFTDSQGAMSRRPVDLVFPLLHGRYGEDGTIQGLLELAQIPYVGCGVLSSALSMDKLMTKTVVGRLGIRQAAYVPVMAEELKDWEGTAKRIEEKLTYPVFVKPANAGSSRGVSCARTRAELKEGLKLAAAEDEKLLVEEMITGHEVECAVFGGGGQPVVTSGVGEILAAAEFYDYDAKYHNAESKTIMDPVLPGNAAQEIPQLAKTIFQAVDGYGLARVDFFVKEDGTVVFSEINTMPGFTTISMYPLLWEARGISKKELTAKLMEHGRKRFDRMGEEG